jgi:hypothetical protein
MMVYKQVPLGHSESILTNAMSIGQFSLLNRVNSSDKKVLTFQRTRDNTSVIRRLQISPTTGWVSYLDSDAQSTPTKGVPTFEEADRLAIQYFQRLGGDTNQISPKPRTPAEGTISTLNRKTGRVTDTAVCSQMITLRRQIAGTDVANYFTIVFANEATPQTIEMLWPNLEPFQEYPIVKPTGMVKLLKSGRAANAELGASMPDDVPLIVTKVQPYYPTLEGVEGMVYPWGHLEVIAQIGRTNRVFRLNCPLIDEDTLPKSAKK